MEKRDSRRRQGKLYVVGIGPGGREDRTRRAEDAIRESSVVAGYTAYLELIKDLTEGKETIASGMTREVERCRAALERAAGGEVVSLVSSGDPGVYGMAGLALEIAAEHKIKVPVEIVPGITSVTVGGVDVHTGDLVFGDIDGVIVVPEESAPEVLRLAFEKQAAEDTMRDELRAGALLGEAFQRHRVL